METDLLKLLVDSGALTVAVILMLYWRKQETHAREQRDLERLQGEREDKLLMISTLQHNTEVLSEMVTLVRQLNGKISD